MPERARACIARVSLTRDQNSWLPYSRNPKTMPASERCMLHSSGRRQMPGVYQPARRQPLQAAVAKAKRAAAAVHGVNTFNMKKTVKVMRQARSSRALFFAVKG